MPVDCRLCPHRNYLLHVFFLPEGIKGTGSGNFKLFGPVGGSFDIRAGAGRRHDTDAACGWSVNPGLYPLERNGEMLTREWYLKYHNGIAINR